MQFKDVIGNEELKGLLTRMAVNGRVSHSIMFIERDGCGALPLALAFVQYLSCRQKTSLEDSCGYCSTCVKIAKCIHPDLHFVFPVNTSGSGDRKPVSSLFIREWTELVQENPYFTEADLYRKIRIEDKAGAISVNEAKEILSRLSLKSYEGYNKYMLIWLPERMSAEAANRLLKIIEEPTPDTYFIFITHAPEKVLGTIRSRTLPIQVHPIEVPVLTKALSARFGITAGEAEAYARSSGGSYGIACRLISEESSHTLYAPLIRKLLEAKLSCDLFSMLSSSDAFIALGREKQKEFFLYFLDFIRKMLMFSHQLQSISNAAPTEVGMVRTFAESLPEAFFEKAGQAVEDARTAIEANVNAKIVFCNFVNYLYVA